MRAGRLAGMVCLVIAIGGALGLTTVGFFLRSL